MSTGDGLPKVDLTLTWDGPPRLSIEDGDGAISVVAHAELSHANVIEACRELDPVVGQAVLSAWQSAVLHPR